MTRRAPFTDASDPTPRRGPWIRRVRGRTHGSRRGVQALGLVAAVLAFAVAMLLDRPIDRALDGTAAQDWAGRKALARVVRLPGNVPLVVLTAAALAWVPRRGWRLSATTVAGAALTGLAVGVIKGLAGRSRPGTWPGTPNWVVLRGGWHGFWHQTNVSFVSGDTAQAFAWAAALWLWRPGVGAVAYAWATLVGVQRVATGAHWASDAVAGAALGVVTVRGLARILRPAPPEPGPSQAEPSSCPTSTRSTSRS